ncbi:MAG: hypothetical protein WCI56_14680 [Hyphomicrobiales bacterium]
MRCLLVAITLAGLLTGASAALAQSGSMGGSIGKQGKAVSGGDERSAPPAAAPAPRKRKAAVTPDDGGDDEQPRVKRGGGSCGRVAGNWTANGWWNAIFGRGDVILRADGSARHNSGIVGTWTCSGGTFVMDWKNWAHGEGSLSPDGNIITFDNGGTMTRGR